VENQEIVVRLDGSLVQPSGIDKLLTRIRPSWKSKALIERVMKLLPVDAGSACQKVLNAAVQDLREKILIAGIDLAKQAAVLEPKLPPIARKEDVLDDYSTFNVLELAYRIGLLSRPEWKRLRRAYDIRRDLEHEDDEYIATLEDVVYIFKSSIEIVLSREPQELLRVNDVEELIQAPQNVTPSPAFLEDYARAPDPRQTEIYQYLVRTALNDKAADVVRQNAVEALASFKATTLEAVKIALAGQMQERTKRKPLSLADVKVAEAGGFRPYLKQRQLEAFFSELSKEFDDVGYSWTQHPQHHAILDKLEDCGGLEAVPSPAREFFLAWMVLCYIGEPGGYGTWGHNRKVFYSNVAAPIVLRMLRRDYKLVQDSLRKIHTEAKVKAACKNEHVKERFDQLIEFLERKSED
jgi:hypothetical protein